jgi:tetratricopeptide (TPR) repeat protein
MATAKQQSKSLLNVASFKRDWEDWTKSIDFYDNIIKKMNSPITIKDKAMLVLAYYKKFELSGGCGYDDLLKAVKLLDLIIIAFPKETIFYIAIARIYELLFDYYNVLINCDKALKIDPNCKEALYKKYKVICMMNGCISSQFMQRVQSIALSTQNTNSSKNQIKRFISKKKGGN